jgi:hypothetical protein
MNVFAGNNAQLLIPRHHVVGNGPPCTRMSIGSNIAYTRMSNRWKPVS